jgi:hypothetical protein
MQYLHERALDTVKTAGSTRHSGTISTQTMNLMQSKGALAAADTLHRASKPHSICEMQRQIWHAHQRSAVHVQYLECCAPLR